MSNQTIWGFPNQQAITTNELGGLLQYKEGEIPATEILTWSGGTTFTRLLETVYPYIIVVDKLILSLDASEEPVNVYSITPPPVLAPDEFNTYLSGGTNNALIDDYFWTADYSGIQVLWASITPGSQSSKKTYNEEVGTFSSGSLSSSTPFDYLELGLISGATITLSGSPALAPKFRYKLWYQIISYK